MTLRQLRTLIAFLNAGSFIGAGEKIGLSHSAVSVQMRQLEDELGVTIFNRSTKPPQMTPLGPGRSGTDRTNPTGRVG